MRMRVGLLVIVLCVQADVALGARWVVNQYGNCVEEWTPSSIARGPLAMVNSLTFPARQLVGGGKIAVEEPSRSTAAKVLLAPTLALLGLGTGTVELVWVMSQGMADFLTGGAFDLVPEESAELSLTPMTPRFLEAPKPKPSTDPCGRPH